MHRSVTSATFALSPDGDYLLKFEYLTGALRLPAAVKSVTDTDLDLKSFNDCASIARATSNRCAA